MTYTPSRSTSRSQRARLGIHQPVLGNAELQVPAQLGHAVVAPAGGREDLHHQIGRPAHQPRVLIARGVVASPVELEIRHHAAALGDSDLVPRASRPSPVDGLRPGREEIAQEDDDVLVSSGRHLDFHQLTIDELAQVVLVQRDEVVPRVEGRGGGGHPVSMPHEPVHCSPGATARISWIRWFGRTRGCPGQDAGCPGTALDMAATPAAPSDGAVSSGSRTLWGRRCARAEADCHQR
jgi:hypothetical protein